MITEVEICLIQDEVRTENLIGKLEIVDNSLILHATYDKTYFHPFSGAHWLRRLAAEFSRSIPLLKSDISIFNLEGDMWIKICIPPPYNEIALIKVNQPENHAMITQELDRLFP